MAKRREDSKQATYQAARLRRLDSSIFHPGAVVHHYVEENHSCRSMQQHPSSVGHRRRLGDDVGISPLRLQFALIARASAYRYCRHRPQLLPGTSSVSALARASSVSLEAALDEIAVANAKLFARE